MEPTRSCDSLHITPSVEELTINVASNETLSCVQCNKVFSHKPALNMHMVKTHKHIHNEASQALFSSNQIQKTKASYYCPVAGCIYNDCKSFGCMKHVKQHYKIMHGEKKFQCSKCGQLFASKHSWKRHEDNCGVIYKCIDCSCVCGSKDALYRHCVMKNHKIPPDMHELHAKLRKSRMKMLPLITGSVVQMEEPSILPQNKDFGEMQIACKAPDNLQSKETSLQNSAQTQANNNEPLETMIKKQRVIHPKPILVPIHCTFVISQDCKQCCKVTAENEASQLSSKASNQMRNLNLSNQSVTAVKKKCKSTTTQASPAFKAAKASACGSVRKKRPVISNSMPGNHSTQTNTTQTLHGWHGYDAGVEIADRQRYIQSTFNCSDVNAVCNSINEYVPFLASLTQGEPLNTYTQTEHAGGSINHESNPCGTPNSCSTQAGEPRSMSYLQMLTNMETQTSEDLWKELGLVDIETQTPYMTEQRSNSIESVLTEDIQTQTTLPLLLRKDSRGSICTETQTIFDKFQDQTVTTETQTTHLCSQGPVCVETQTPLIDLAQLSREILDEDSLDDISLDENETRNDSAIIQNHFAEVEKSLVPICSGPYTVSIQEGTQCMTDFHSHYKDGVPLVSLGPETTLPLSDGQDEGTELSLSVHSLDAQMVAGRMSMSPDIKERDSLVLDVEDDLSNLAKTFNNHVPVKEQASLMELSCSSDRSSNIFRSSNSQEEAMDELYSQNTPPCLQTDTESFGTYSKCKPKYVQTNSIGLEWNAHKQNTMSVPVIIKTCHSDTTCVPSPDLTCHWGMRNTAAAVSVPVGIQTSLLDLASVETQTSFFSPRKSLTNLTDMETQTFPLPDFEDNLGLTDSYTQTNWRDLESLFAELDEVT